jgi:predicted MFS family arabinose efflux permease
MAVIMGSTPVGAPIAGWVADVFGPRAAIMLGGTAGLIACAIGAIWVFTSGRLHRDENRRFLLTLDETRPLSIIDEVDPVEFSDEAAVTTPIRSARPKD